MVCSCKDGIVRTGVIFVTDSAGAFLGIEGINSIKVI